MICDYITETFLQPQGGGKIFLHVLSAPCLENNQVTVSIHWQIPFGDYFKEQILNQNEHDSMDRTVVVSPMRSFGKDKRRSD